MSRVTLLAVFAGACDFGSDAPAEFKITDATLAAEPLGQIAAGGAANEGGTLADSLAVELRLQVQAPAGHWSVNVTAGGALTTPANQPATTFDSSGHGPVQVAVPLRVTGAIGTGFVHVVVGTTRGDYRFPIGGDAPSIDFCTQTTSGTCPPTGNGGTGGAAKTECTDTECTVPLAGSSVDQLHDSDQFLVTVKLPAGTAPNAAELSWPGTVTADGIFSLGSPAAPQTTQRVTFAKGTPSVTLPAFVTGAGTGIIRASVTLGAEKSESRVAVSSTEGVHRVQLDEYVGLGARNTVIICSTRSSGTLHVESEQNSGTIVPADAPLVVVPGELCPEGYPSHASFVWTGHGDLAYLSITRAGGTTKVLNAIPTLGTTSNASAAQDGDVIAICEKPATGNGDGGAGGDSGAGGGGGAPEGGCAGPWSIYATVKVMRAPQGSDRRTEPAIGAGIALELPPGIERKESGTLTTDAQGRVALKLRAAMGAPSLQTAAGVTNLPIFVAVDGRVTRDVLLHWPEH
jgi:hypothetical protein